MRALTTNPFATACVAAFSVFVCWLLAGWGGQRTTAVVAAIGFIAFSVLACVRTAATARATTGEVSAGWATLAVGFLGWVAGSLIWAYYEAVRAVAPPFPSVADIGFLALPAALGVIWLRRTPFGSLAMFRQLLDGAIIGSALALLYWVTVLRDLLAVDQSSGRRAALTVVYPIADLTMVTIAVVLLITVPPARRRALTLAAAGIVLIAVGDSATLYLQLQGGFSDTRLPLISRVAGLMLTALAAHWSATAPADVPGPAPLRTTVLWLPYLPLPFAVVVGGAYLWPNPDTRPVVLAAATLLIASAIRQVTVLVQNRRLLDEVAEHAFRDPLTGLANRLLFTDRLNHAIELRYRDGRPVAVLTLDLDDFKLVNDNLGHHWGDELLRQIADRLVRSMPEGHTVARLGGDEFAIIIEAGPEAPADIAQRVARAFDRAFYLDAEEVFMHPSIGLAIAPEPSGDDRVRVGADDLLKRADVAMYSAKRSGVGGVQVFTDGMRIDRGDMPASWSDSGRVRLPLVSEIKLLGQLRRGVDSGKLRLVYQPKVSLRTGDIVGAEALVRWPHPEFGMLTPNQFLPLIRRNGLMGAVTDLVLQQAAHDTARWYRTGGCEVTVAINLFAPSFNDATLPARIGAVLADNGLPPEAVTIEITEHYLLANVRKARLIIEQLRQSGLRVSIDDFGSGYATMSYLRDLPIDELKLDRHFIAPILHNTRADAIVQSVIGLTHALGITSVAEGVEDAATAERLNEYGCDLAQGNYFAEPMFADALCAALSVSSPEVAPPSGA